VADIRYACDLVKKLNSTGKSTLLFKQKEGKPAS
jgi:hypothetical protein